MAKLLGQCSDTAWAGWTGGNKRRAFPSLLQSLLAASQRPACLRKKELPPLLYWLSSRVKNVPMLCKFRAVTSHFSFHVNWNFRWNWRELVTDHWLLCSIFKFRSLIGLWVNMGHRNKSECSSMNSLHAADLNWRTCSRSKLTTCPSSDSNQTAQLLQMAASKSLETMSGMILFSVLTFLRQ